MRRDWLITLRDHKNLTQSELSQMVNLSQTYYSLIEVGKRDPSVSAAKRIAEILGFEWTRFYENQQIENSA